ncbi:hypothetical protein FUAX_52820 (plasmid) [Fulvitalea axinellae]|uniref:Uncharacterized protein n=1 Tax=Fulvitalea axinellae TaxID=1182444 RepID=A0AAU9DNS3_9BACT|nr:hypothetical protein FUAX_52820 [Fulvitalea axinellae]
MEKEIVEAIKEWLGVGMAPVAGFFLRELVRDIRRLTGELHGIRGLVGRIEERMSASERELRERVGALEDRN